jgi:hypothetical protein
MQFCDSLPFNVQNLWTTSQIIGGSISNPIYYSTLPLLLCSPSRPMLLDVNLVHAGVGQMWVPAYYKIVENKQ